VQRSWRAGKVAPRALAFTAHADGPHPSTS
jgi:hypothetical protein